MTETMECGCRIVRKLALQEIEYCPMHQAAEELLDALKTLCAPTIVRPVGFGEQYERAEAAIAKATGG